MDYVPVFESVAYKAGRDHERERIIKWIEENRTGMELAEGVVMYRDHFKSEDLIAFLKGESK